jgi:sugar O-acyltransferase (sialic acid O-acetyltransferase NeuD family)
VKPLFILGTGGQARDVAEIADVTGYRPVFVTRDARVIASWALTDEIAHEDEVVVRTSEMFAIGIGDNRVREKVAARLRGTLCFPALIHPDTSFGRGQWKRAAATEGSILFAGVRITANVHIGDFCIINVNATLSHDVELHDFASISPGANIAGNVRIGKGALIGIGAAVNQGDDTRKLEIGDWCVIGSGAVVTHDCASDSVYAGVPARKIQ